MIQERAVQALYQRIGWRQPYDPKYAIVDAANQVSKSGKLFQDFNAIVSIKNVMNTQDYADISTDDFNIFLQDLQHKSIRFVLEAVFDTKVLENKTLLRDHNRTVETWSLDANHFQGVEFTLRKHRDMAIDLKQVGLYFNETAPNFPMYLFHSSQNDPIEVYDLATVANTEFFSDISTQVYAFSDQIKGGTYYLGYRTEDVTGEPIKRDEKMP